MIKNTKSKLILAIINLFFISNILSIQNQEIIFISTRNANIVNTNNTHWTHDRNARITYNQEYDLYQTEYNLNEEEEIIGIFSAQNANGITTNLQCHYFTTNPEIFKIIRINI